MQQYRAKSFNLAVLRVLMSSFNARMPEKTAARNPAMTEPAGRTDRSIWRKFLSSSTVVAPKMAGIASRKLNSTAHLRFRPRSSAVQIVEPEREMPGIMATAWARPMTEAFLRLKFRRRR